MTYRSIYWTGNEARLKSFSASAKSDARSVVKKAAGRLLDGREWNDMPGRAGKAVAA